jgi:flagellar biosynthesis protein FlhF
MADPIVIPTSMVSQPITVPANRGTRLDRIGQAKVHAPSAVEPVQSPDALLKRLIAADVDEAIGRKLLNQLPNLSGWTGAARDAMAESALRDILTRQIACSGAIDVPAGKQTVVALVGATGVGKTTTIAKLAAHYSLVEGRKVALVSMDTYRIAAVEQLKVYAQIIGMPVKVVHNAAELRPVLESLAEYELILIDTAGRSQKNASHMEELRAALAQAKCQTQLVLAASTKRSDLKDQVERFSKMGIDRLLFTKLDETSTYGSIFSIAAMADAPVSYLTTGQKVPEDIEVAQASRLAGILVDSLPQASGTF